MSQYFYRNVVRIDFLSRTILPRPLKVNKNVDILTVIVKVNFTESGLEQFIFLSVVRCLKPASALLVRGMSKVEETPDYLIHSVLCSESRSCSAQLYNSLI